MDIKKFKLYHYPLTRSSRVRWLLHEIFDDNFELEIVNIHNGQLHKKNFISIQNKIDLVKNKLLSFFLAI